MKKRQAASLKGLSRALVIALAADVALAAFNVSIPGGKSAASNWRFVLTHPTILLHIIVAAGVLVAAAIAVIMPLRSRDWSGIAVSVTGLAFVLLAFAAGVGYVMSLQKSALNYMSIGWTGAVITYGTGWYLGHRKTRRREGPRASELAESRLARPRGTAGLRVLIRRTSVGRSAQLSRPATTAAPSGPSDGTLKHGGP